MVNGIIHFLLIKEFCFKHERYDVWNVIYHCADFDDSDFITIRSIYDIINSVDSDCDDFLKDLVLYILFECTDYINF